MKKYVYPKFSKYEFLGFRLSGPGLGNLLFIYARALIYAEKYHLQIIWPTWFSFRIGPWLKHEMDKRTYHDLFVNNSGYINGLMKYYLLATSSKDECSDSMKDKTKIVLFTYNHMKMSFEDLIPYRELIVTDLEKNLQGRNTIYKNFDYKNTIAVHVRLGDFKPLTESKLAAGKNNLRIPISWYVDIIQTIQSRIGKNIHFLIYSDGTDSELTPILNIKGTERISFGNSIADIFGMANSKIILASGSSFSMWARFIGQSSCLTYIGQLKSRALEINSKGFELEVASGNEISDVIFENIKKLFDETEKE